ncbi:MAG: fimbrillin family protein [Muribaculaceae bacterium]|nr:fimbrillin family protein [Muribaculaceae bacterium]
MRSALILSLAATLATTTLSVSCTSDDPIASGDIKGNSIKFGVSTDYLRSSKMTDNILKEFHVYAYNNNAATPYIDNLAIRKTDGNEWQSTSSVYWPSNGSLSFYAFAPGDLVDHDPREPNYYDTFADSNPATTDLLYAVNRDMTAPGAKVGLNFRHALSKVAVKMMSGNSNLIVNVSNVIINGVNSRGNFHFPEANTSDYPAPENTGTWTDQNTPKTLVLHQAKSADQILTLSSTATDLGDLGLGYHGAKFVIPQTLNQTNENGNEAYIGVMCLIYDANTGEKLWPNANTSDENMVNGSAFGDGLLKFPLSSSLISEWYPGYHYIYNLIIDSNEDTASLEFVAPTVDSYVEVTSTYE